MTASQASPKLSSDFVPLRPTHIGIESAIVFAVATFAFLFLRSHNLTAVDGPIRAFDIYREPHLKFHSSSHMLSPVYVLAWTQAIAKLGFSLADPKDFIRAVQAMNATLAAGCCAILFALVRSLTGSRTRSGNRSWGNTAECPMRACKRIATRPALSRIFKATAGR